MRQPVLLCFLGDPREGGIPLMWLIRGRTAGQRTVFNRLNAAAFIKFFEIRVRRLFEGGVYLKSNSFLTNNNV